MQILLATTNPGKVVEMRRALADLRLELISLDQLPTVEPPPETGSTLAANAALKAAYYFSHFGIPTLADDSGLMVDALGGRPGVQTARFAATDSGRIKKLVSLLADLEAGGSASRSAHFSCAVCLHTSRWKLESSGRVDGEIAPSPRGKAGFGYDPIFHYPPLGLTFGEMRPRQKDALSHRAQALARLRRQLIQRLGRA